MTNEWFESLNSRSYSHIYDPWQSECLFMKLQVKDLAKKMLQWTKVGGYIFFRESCFHRSGDNKRKYNPTHYREPKFYTKVVLPFTYPSLPLFLDYFFFKNPLWCMTLFQLFKECHMDDDVGNSYELSLVSCKCIGAYVRNKKNQNQVITRPLHSCFSHTYDGIYHSQCYFSQISDMLALAESQFG